MKSTLHATPLDLGSSPQEVDPFSVQPGVFLFKRFCVIGRVRHSSDYWRVGVTDIDRQLGLEPHHRLDLHVLPSLAANERVIRAALPAHQRGGRRIDALLSARDCIVIVSSPCEDAPSAPFTSDDARIIARALLGILLEAHREGVVGWRFDLRDLRLDAFGEVQFASWRHLAALRFADPADPGRREDEIELIELLRSLGDPWLKGAIDAHNGSVANLLVALETALSPSAPSVSELIPALPPFAGRELLLRRLHEAMAEARHKGPGLFLLKGPPGYGRSRTLSQLSLEWARWGTVHLVEIVCREASPHHGLGVLLDALAASIEALPARDRQLMVARIQRAIGIAGIDLGASPKLERLLSSSVRPHVLQVTDAFIRRSSVIADILGAVGTPERPMALLVDDADRADASIQGVLYQLSEPTRRHNCIVILTAPEQAVLDLPRPPVTMMLRQLPLSSVKEILVSTIPGPIEAPERAAQRLHNEAKGSPSHTWNLLHRWLRSGILTLTDQGVWLLRDESTDSVPAAEPLADLSARAREIGALLAIHDEPIAPTWLSELTSLSASETREAAFSLIGAGLAVQDTGGRLGFPGDAPRRQLLAELKPEEIRKAHDQFRIWLLARGSAALGRLAWHTENAAPLGHDPSLAELHLRAGEDHLSCGDANRAQWHFERAIARIEDLESRAAIDARRGLADALALQDRIQEALRLYLDVINRTEPVAALEIAHSAMHTFYMRRAITEMLVVAERALGAVGQGLPRNMFDAALVAVRSLLSIVSMRGPVDPKLADGLASIHTTLVAGAFTLVPHVGLGSLMQGLLAASRRSSGPAARARAFFSVVLGSVGFERLMYLSLSRAEAEAKRSGDPLSLGTVLHVRGQNEMGLGQYEAGGASFERALQEFRRIGDLSVGAMSMALATFYAMDRDALGTLLQKLRSAETTAWRQRNNQILPLIQGVHLYVLARSGAIEARDVEQRALALEDGDVAAAVMGDSLASLALLRVGRPNQALIAAIRARTRLDESIPAHFLEVARLAEALASIEAAPIEAARTAVRKLEQKAKTVRSLAIASEIARARLALREDDIPRAITLLASIVDRTHAHGERWHTLDAHLLLSSALAGRNVLAAQAHAERARRLAAELNAGLPESPQTQVQTPAGEGQGQNDLGLRGILESVQETLDTILPPEVLLESSSTSGARALGDGELVELLVMNLVLLVRDCLIGGSTIRILADEVELTVEDTLHELREGRWARIEVRAEGSVGQTSRGALTECRALCHRCGGHLLVETGDAMISLSAFLPAPAGPPAHPSGLVAVIHSDEEVRRMLVDGVRRVGFSVVELPPGESPPRDAVILLVEVSLCHLVQPGKARLLRVARRGQRCAETVHLRIPYLVSELDSLLTEEDPSTSARG